MVAAMLAAAALFAASWQPAPLVRVRHQRAPVLETVRTPLERVSTQRAPAVEMLLPKARLPPTTRRPTRTTWHPTTHHLGPATHHLPPATYLSPPATYHLTLTTCHLPEVGRGRVLPARTLRRRDEQPAR